MRGTVLAKNGRTILALLSTADHGRVSRIVPFLKEGVGTSLIRGDIHYVVTEYGIAYLHGKNIRERAMELIAIAHPDFRPALIEEARQGGLIYRDQKFVPGKSGEYPEELETYRTTKTGEEIFLRPVKISDEPLLKEFIYSLSDRSMHRRFITLRKDMHHDRLQECRHRLYEENGDHGFRAGRSEGSPHRRGEYVIVEETHTADVAHGPRRQPEPGHRHGTAALPDVSRQASGAPGVHGPVISENEPMLHVFEKLWGGYRDDDRHRVLEPMMMFRE